MRSFGNPLTRIVGGIGLVLRQVSLSFRPQVEATQMRIGRVHCSGQAIRFRPRFLSFFAKASSFAQFWLRYNPEFSGLDQSLSSSTDPGCGEILGGVSLLRHDPLWQCWLSIALPTSNTIAPYCCWVVPRIGTEASMDRRDSDSVVVQFAGSVNLLGTSEL